jgi:hypothetical protein
MSILAFQTGGSAFVLVGSPIARNALVTELGVNYAICPCHAYSVNIPAGLTGTPARRISSFDF